MLILETPTTVKLTKCNTRQEHHGEALVLAVDLVLSWKTHNRSLDMLHVSLRQSLYGATILEARDDADDGDQGEMELPVDDLSYILFPKMRYPVKFEYEQTGMKATVEYGLGGISDIVLHNAVASKISVTPIEGGSCEIEWLLSCNSDIDWKIAGKLCDMQQRDITLIMLGPVGAEIAESKMAALDVDPDATDIFVDTHGTAH